MEKREEIQAWTEGREEVDWQVAARRGRTWKKAGPKKSPKPLTLETRAQLETLFALANLYLARHALQGEG